ncbi:MAG TPA: tetratricopeptide repeat protein [Acidobacteriaceae bacterium]|nr:tetratricopeptide repeat protein [Acidobacteriaceae bacterium]
MTRTGSKTRHVIRIASIVLALFSAAALTAHAQDKPAINVTGYKINAAINPADHTLTAVTSVTFTALQSAPVVQFGLHGALKVSQVTDEDGNTLNGQRGPNATVLVTPAAPLTVGKSYTWTFSYNGALEGEGGPVPGLKLAYVGAPITYLLYAGDWFPTVGYQTDRFTADIKVHVPKGYKVVGSGPVPVAAAAPATPATTPPAKSKAGKHKSKIKSSAKEAPASLPTLAVPPGTNEYDFQWDKPGFPGTIIAGKFIETSPAPNIHVYTTKKYKQNAEDYAQSTLRIFTYFTSTFGLPESYHINVVQLPDDTVPAYWAPELAAVAGNRIPGKTSYRLLSNTISHQWWGSEISPATNNDAWITNGMSRYAELMYLQSSAGEGATEAALLDVSAGALAYDTIPLTSAGQLNIFTPEFQSMTLEKGAMVFHMLVWEVGRGSFINILRATLSQYTDKSITTADFEKIAEAQSQKELTPFFSQWLNGTGAPDFHNKWAVYRLGNNKGFRTIGEIKQNLDLFNMPVELQIQTDGKTANRVISVVGTDSQYVVDTFGRPRRIIIDPNDWILKNSSDMQVRVDILKGQQLVAQGDLTGALAQYQKALKVNPQSSLASYRIGEVFFTQRNMQAAVDAYRDALNGDDDPKWTEVWSHIQIGKIFDMTGQRQRAVEEYRQAIQTNDNTSGALNAARHYIQVPYKAPPME